jgi:hypothetical protein
VIEIFIQRGLKLKNYSLVLDITLSLIALLKTDEVFNCIGQEGSVVKKMKENNAFMYFSALSHHNDENVFQASQELMSLYKLFSSEITSDNDSMVSGSPDKQNPENI